MAPAEDLTPGSDLSNAMVKAAKAVRGKIIFVSSKLGTDDGAPIVSFFGLDAAATKPQVGWWALFLPSRLPVHVGSLLLCLAGQRAGCTFRLGSQSASPWPGEAGGSFFLPGGLVACWRVSQVLQRSGASLTLRAFLTRFSFLAKAGRAAALQGSSWGRHGGV